MPRATYSLHNRLAVALAVVLTIGGIGVAIAAIAYGHKAAQQSFDRLLIGSANHIAEAVYLHDGAVTVDLPISAFQLLALAPDDRVIYSVMERGGTLITGYPGLASPTDETPFFNATFTGEAVRVAHVARHFSERSYSGTIDVLVGQTLGARRQLAQQITRNSLILAALAGGAMVALSIFAVRSALSRCARSNATLPRGRSRISPRWRCPFPRKSPGWSRRSIAS